jgi:hypothetical protein
MMIVPEDLTLEMVSLDWQIALLDRKAIVASKSNCLFIKKLSLLRLMELKFDAICIK